MQVPPIRVTCIISAFSDVTGNRQLINNKKEDIISHEILSLYLYAVWISLIFHHILHSALLWVFVAALQECHAVKCVLLFSTQLLHIWPSGWVDTHNLYLLFTLSVLPGLFVGDFFFVDGQILGDEDDIQIDCEPKRRNESLLLQMQCCVMCDYEYAFYAVQYRAHALFISRLTRCTRTGQNRRRPHRPKLVTLSVNGKEKEKMFAFAVVVNRRGLRVSSPLLLCAKLSFFFVQVRHTRSTHSLQYAARNVCKGNSLAK